MFGFDVSKIAHPKVFIAEPFEVSEVIDARNTTYLGSWNDGYVSQNIHVAIDSMSNHFKTLFQPKSDPTASTVPITIRINYFSLESTFNASGNPCLAGINLSFLQKEGSFYIELFQAAEHLYWDEMMPGQVYRSLSKLIGKSITRFNDYNASHLLSSTKFPVSDLLSVQYICPTKDSPKKGLYLDYYSYRENRPDTNYQAKYFKKAGGTKDKPYVRLSKLTPEYNEYVFGFNNGRSVYIGLGNTYIPSFVKDDQIFINYSGLSKQELITIGYSSFLFGAVGGLIATGIIHHNKKNRDATYFDPNTSVLDPRIGALIPAKRAKDISFARDLNPEKKPLKQVIILVQNFSAKGDTISISDGDTINFKLTRGQYSKFTIPQEESKAAFSFVSSSGQEKEFRFNCNTSELQIIRLTVSRKGDLDVNEPDDKIYDDILNQIKTNHFELALN